jgi:DNA repair photolyase
MMMKKRCGIIKNYQEWLRPKLVANAMDLLEKEIPKYKKDIKFVHLCFSTDPFMYKQPEVVDLTLKIIRRLNADGIRCTSLTKGVYPKALTDKRKYSVQNEYGITLVSLNERFKMIYEPFSSSFNDRVKSLRMLHDAGLHTWISIEPYPTPNLIQQDLYELLSRISFVNKIVFGRLNYNPMVSKYNRSKEFYNECVDIVETFCRKRSIEYHIKFGTRTSATNTSVVKTVNLFRNPRWAAKQKVYLPAWNYA